MTVGRRALALLVAVSLAACHDPGPPVGGDLGTTLAGPTDGEAAADLLAAYERSRRATYVLEQTWVRSVGGASVAPVPLRIVQRPPLDRLQVGGGSASGAVGGRVVRCNAAVGGAPGAVECVDGGPAGDDDAMVAGEVAVLARLLEGPTPTYAVAVGGEAGCFDLRLRRHLAAPPYGLAATFCFDGATGAVRRRSVDHGDGVTDEFRATAIRAEVTDADLVVGAVGALPATPVPGSGPVPRPATPEPGTGPP